MIKIDLRQEGDPRPRRDISKAMEKVATIMRRSIELNFKAGGRPTSWLPLKKGTGKPLWGAGVLRGTLRTHSGGNFAEAAIGGGLPYAWIHQRGGMAGRGHKANIPARPYMVLQREDLDRIGKMLGEFIVHAPGGEDAIY